MKKFFLYSFTLFITLATSLALAKSVNLYDQPLPNAKVVGTVDANSRLVPIITSKNGDWMKVGDPSNGNVGWVKVSDFNGSNKNGNSSSGFTMTEQTIDSAQGPQTYRTIQFGTPDAIVPNADSVKAEEIIKRAQAQQLQMQRNNQQILQNIYRDMNMLYQNSGNSPGFPVFMPVIFVPTQALPPTPATHKPAPANAKPVAAPPPPPAPKTRAETAPAP